MVKKSGNDISTRKDSEKLYRVIFDTVPVSIWEGDCIQAKCFLGELKANGIRDLRAYFTEHPDEILKAAGLVRIINVNDYTLRLFEAKSKDELLSSWTHLIIPESLPALLDALIALAGGQCHFKAEAPVQTLARKPLTALFEFSFPAVEMSSEHMLVCITDITERKRMEDVLRQNKEQYRRQFDEATDAMFLADAKTGIILDCNIAATALVERERAEIIGMHQKFLHPHEDRKQEITAAFRKHVIGEPAEIIEEKVITKSGRLKDVAIKATRIILQDKEILQGIFRDITEQKRMEEKLRQSVADLRLAHRIARVASWSWDQKNDIVNWSEELYRITGTDQKHFVPTYLKFSRLCTPDSQQRLNRAVEKALADGTPYELELEIVRPDGGHRWILAFGEPIGDTVYHPAGLFGVVFDITERKHMEEAKKNLVIDVSHSLKTPLAVIEMALNMSERGIKSNDRKRIKKGHAIAYENISRLRKYISRMLEAFTVDLREMSLEKKKKRVSLRKIVRKIFKEIKSAAQEKGLTLKVDISVTAGMVSAGQREVGVILENLIDNAVKFTDKGTISVASRRKEGWVEIRIKDTGRGIDPQNKTKLFEMFFKRYTVVEGLGLGLFICKRLTDLLGGQIQIESKGLGKGAEVILRLPH
jgi:PAS domain S-box-containing protein